MLVKKTSIEYKMKQFIEKYNIQIKLLGALLLGVVVLAVLFYFLIPAILNYPEGTYNSNFQYELEQTNYNVQVVLISLAIFISFVIIVFNQTRFLVKYQKMFEAPKKFTEKEINYVRNKLYNVPYTMYLLNIILPSILITVIHAFTIKQFGMTTIKIFILLLTFITVYVSGVLIYTKRLFKELLLKLPTLDKITYKRVSIKHRFFHHILPLIIIAILFTALIGYSKIIYEKGNSVFEIYRERLSYYTSINHPKNLDELVEGINTIPLYNEDDIAFIRKPNGTYINANAEEIDFSAYFNKYLNEYSENKGGRVYEYYGVDAQGCVDKVNIGGETYLIGVYYEISSSELLLYFFSTFVVLMIIDCLVLYMFATSYASDIQTVADNFANMAKQNEGKMVEKIVNVSNDEVGDLCVAFNNIQDLTTQYIEQIHSSQDILVERERLASLGQMIGGIAHNLKTPIMSISGAAEGLTDLIKEYDTSIGDKDVTENDHHEIAKDMLNWVEKVKDYTAYMSDIITAVKGQAVTLSEEQSVDFTIEELVKRINILMKHELKNALVTLNTDIKVDDKTQLKGNINSLVQVVNNMISNAIQSYNGKPDEKIDMSIYKEDKNIIIKISDYGCGLPSKVKDKLFKEMITTKGKNGTGLGLFMSYSNIRAHFNGNITFETKEGKGTTFYISLPLE